MKNFFVHLGVVVFFIAVAAIFFKPAVFEGKMIVAGDSEKVIGMNKEIRDYQDRTGEGVSWTGSMFSGMPSYTISAPDGPRNYLFDAGLKVFWFLGSTDAGIIFLAMFGMYLFLISMGYGIGISVFGAVAYAFSSYFIIILPAGHVCKAWAMSYLPLVLLGIMLLFKQKWLWGIVVFAASMSLELRSNHIQITYYFAILCVFLFLAFAIGKILNKDYKSLVKTTGFLVLGSFLAIASTADRMYSNYEMSAVSTRGPSRLSAAADGKTDKSTGLDRDYAFAWSYGLGELTTLLVPNSYGGESGGELGADSHISTALRMHNYQVSGPMRMPTYWGAQPFTSGPVYLGAIVCFLAVLSFFISKNKYKWWLVGASVFFIILSLGNNAPIVNNFLFDHLPMYNKFRTPSMALVMPQLTFAILGCMALKTILDGDYDEKKINKYLAISVGIVGGFCLLVWAAPTLFLDCSSAADDGYTKQYGDWFTAALIEDRASLASSDAFRSLLYILATAAILWYVIKKENRKYVNVAMGAIAILTLVDLWGVSRRYCDEDNFTKKLEYHPYQQTVADAEILKDKDLSYRVLTFRDPFNDTHVPYFHKSIGGYNAAKLRDYQDLIDMHIAPEMQYIQESFKGIRTLGDLDSVFSNTPALNMLNMRYLIYNDAAAPLKNNKALGNAWFVQNYKILKDTTLGGTTYTADDLEIKMLGSVNPGKTALVVNKFRGELEGKSLAFDPESSIQLTSYKPNEVVYKSKSKTENLALFSEIYYPLAWTATIDGQPASHFRSNWLLRSMVIPAGEHTIVFKNYAETYWTLRNMSSILSLIMLLAVLGVIGYEVYGAWKDSNGTKATSVAKKD